jgi:hypothetical protein
LNAEVVCGATSTRERYKEKLWQNVRTSETLKKKTKAWRKWLKYRAKETTKDVMKNVAG